MAFSWQLGSRLSQCDVGSAAVAVDAIFSSRNTNNSTKDTEQQRFASEGVLTDEELLKLAKFIFVKTGK
jgi:hypothetical protein